MLRIYKTREGAQKRIPIDNKNMKLAVNDVLESKSIRGTAKARGISIMTLERYVRK